MKKIAPYIRNKQGSMLMLTLIVFMVILILGMTMITSMLYSQGENNMQINEQKAYYAAQSAVDAVKSYFLNPTSEFISTTSITSPHDLIGTTGTYTLKAQGIDEDTTVSIRLTNEGPVPNESSKNYILIEATGNCQGESSTVRARIIEEMKQGASGGLYSSQVVFGSSSLQINSGSTIKGNLYLGDTGTGGYIGTVNNLNMVRTEETESTVYIKSKNTFQFTDNNLVDVYIELDDPQGYMVINQNTAENMYIRNKGSSNVGFQFQSNKVKGEAQLYLGGISLNNMYNNTINWRLVLGFNKGQIVGWLGSDTPELYIKGLQKYDESSGGIFGNIQNKYIDEKTEIKSNSGLISKDLSYFDSEEERISTVISGLEEVEHVLKNNPSWNKDIVIQNAILIDEEVKPGIPVKNPANSNFEEYYDPTQNVRWVFSKNSGYEEIVGPGSTGSGDSNPKYYLDNNDETVFFISEATGLNMYVGQGQSIDNFYIYAPNTYFSFQSDFQYFGGSIIAKSIQAYKGPKEIEFKSPEGIQNTGEPSMGGESTSVGGSSGISYTYYFEEYVD